MAIAYDNSVDCTLNVSTRLCIIPYAYRRGNLQHDAEKRREKRLQISEY